MPNYETLTKLDKGIIRLFFEDFATGVGKNENEERGLRYTRLRLSYSLCGVVRKYRVVEGVTNAPAFTVTDIRPKDKDLIEDLLMLYKYKNANQGERKSSRNERLFLNIVYRRFDNLALKYY